ncbi:hypothetical protein B0J12DRAFT_775828 [Macrophomina phaseolina]|uniref:General substrate transporter n=1 Tax=Macrophomina phaseolina TaxID=35725 RepID=A0ABQ8FTZ1_9PEZI|nr:hypothetical protein B0J12DRAFT_775828 [Macrophomina phaseolina]
MRDVEEFCYRFDLMGHVDLMKQGALVVQNPSTYHGIAEISNEDKTCLERDKIHKWKQPWQLCWLVSMSSLAAAVQGMGETVNNGARAFYLDELGITSPRFTKSIQDSLTGRVVGAPYLACAILGCCLTEPVNKVFARMGTIFISCLIAAIGSICEGVCNSWVNLFLARFCAPAPIRGALVMQWQVWTAFGIMLGSIMSPRWLLQHGKMQQAFRSFCITCTGVGVERKVNKGKYLITQFWELFSIPRNRRASLATWVGMFVQQSYGVNVIAQVTQRYYSTAIFQQGGYGRNSALFASTGTGILNWVLALRAFGRRNFVRTTFPLLSTPTAPDGHALLHRSPTTWQRDLHRMARLGMIMTGVYLAEVFYSPGMGPVPFSYSAQSFPMHMRDVGISFATATAWCFNFIPSFPWAQLGAFGWYAAWCVILWLLMLLFMPETRALTLEELGQVFGVPTWEHSRYQTEKAVWHFKRYVLFQKKLEPLAPFYEGAES